MNMDDKMNVPSDAPEDLPPEEQFDDEQVPGGDYVSPAPKPDTESKITSDPLLKDTQPPSSTSVHKPPPVDEIIGKEKEKEEEIDNIDPLASIIAKNYKAVLSGIPKLILTINTRKFLYKHLRGEINIDEPLTSDLKLTEFLEQWNSTVEENVYVDDEMIAELERALSDYLRTKKVEISPLHRIGFVSLVALIQSIFNTIILFKEKRELMTTLMEVLERRKAQQKKTKEETQASRPPEVKTETHPSVEEEKLTFEEEEYEEETEQTETSRNTETTTNATATTNTLDAQPQEMKPGETYTQEKSSNPIVNTVKIVDEKPQSNQNEQDQDTNKQRKRGRPKKNKDDRINF